MPGRVKHERGGFRSKDPKPPGTVSSRIAEAPVAAEVTRRTRLPAKIRLVTSAVTIFELTLAAKTARRFAVDRIRRVAALSARL